MLDPLAPFTLINRAVGPEHLSVAIALVILIISLVDVAALPGKDSLAILAVVDVLAIILIARRECIGLFLPLAFAVFEALSEFTHVDAA